MKKLNNQTPDLTDKKIEQIAKIFPQVITEKEDENGNIVKAVDFDLLRRELSRELVEDDNERYRLDWPGKKASLLKANTPINKTLRPVREESVNFDTTENLYIEGDNFEALKILQESYLGKVKMIYIDPPYNTGQDFVYKDNFKKSKEEYEEELEVVDDEGGKLVKNTDTNGRYHSDWLSMMYERIIIARDLLRADGVIFISIDDNEVHNLRKLCDEIFGEDDYIGTFIWPLPRGINAGLIARSHEYTLLYAKNIQNVKPFNRIEGVTESIERCNRKIDARHPLTALTFPKGMRYEGKNQKFSGTIDGNEKIIIQGEMIFEDGRLKNDVTLEAGWTMKEMIKDWIKGKEVYDLKGQKIIEFFFKENGKLYSKKELTVESPKSILKNIPDTQTARKDFEKLFDNISLFDFPKPTELLSYYSHLVTKDSDIVLDFFSGSATAAHAVMELNATDEGKRKFIMIQIPEKTKEDSEAYKVGYKTITDIGKERIRRAAKKIKEDFKDELAKRETPLDTGFRVYKVDSTNMSDVWKHPSEVQQEMFKDVDTTKQESLMDFVDNIKNDRTPEDLLTETILKLGLELSLPITTKKIKENTVYFVQENSLVACFDTDIDFSIVDEIAKENPLKVVFRDSSFKDDKDRINVETRFKQLSPETEISVL